MVKAILKNIFSTTGLFYALVLFITLPAVILSFTEPLGPAGAMANTLVILGATWWTASLSRNIGRTVWLMFPLIFLAAFQTVLLDLYGRSIIAVDMFLNLVTTNAGEVAELLTNMLPVVIFVVVVYLPQLVMAVVYIRRKEYLTTGFLRINRRIGGTVAAAGLLALLTAEVTQKNYSMKADLYPVNVLYNVYLAVDRTIRTGKYHETSAGFSFGAVDADTVAGRKIVLLLIGETSRAADWQICGYDRPTTSRLAALDGLYVGKNAVSESNTTHKSVPMLLSQIDAADFDSIYYVKGIISAFREAGYRTAFFSNQRRNGSFIDFFGMEADTVSFIRDNEGEIGELSPDSRLLASLADELRRPDSRQLIVIHTYGSHFNYSDRYDGQDAVFKPVDYPEALARYRDKLINAYDNSIVATDRFISRAVEMIDSAAPLSVMLYTSDHGEDIFDDGNGYFLHASPLPTYYQVHVPMLVWLSGDYSDAHPDKAVALEHNISLPVSTSRSYFHTALDLGLISTRSFDPAASLASPAYQPREQLYLNDHNKPVLLREVDKIKIPR